MLKQQYRLRKQKEFDRVFEKNRRIKSEYFQVLVHFRRNLLEPKFGIIVSSKVGKAVIRNKIKRRIREIIRANIDKFPVNGEYVFIAFPQIVNIEFNTLNFEINTVIKQLQNQNSPS